VSDRCQGGDHRFLEIGAHCAAGEQD